MNCNPVIIIPGIGQSKLILADDKGNKIKNAWPFEIDQKAILNELKGSLMKLMLFKKDGGFSDRVAEIVKDIAEPLAVNPDGSKKYNIQPVSYRKSVAECSDDEKRYIYKMVPVENTDESKLFFFSYDFLGDIADTAASLDEFITFVKSKTDSEKVDLLTISTGGAVLKAYLKDYSVKCDCEKILNIVSALDGSSAVADIFENKLKLDNPIKLLSSLGGTAATVAPMAGMLPSDVITNIINKALDVIMTNLIKNCTSVWSLIPNDRFDAVFALQKPTEKLAKKVKAQHDYSVNFANEAKKLESQGMKFCQICGYGKKLPVIVESEDTDSDGIIDTTSASLGNFSNTFGNEPSLEHCAFPETTWFFKGLSHEAVFYNDAALSLVLKIIKCEDTSEYPHFNGSRNIKKLKNELIPKAKKAVSEANGQIKTQLENCISEYDSILSVVIIENDDDIKNLESKIESMLASINE